MEFTEFENKLIEVDPNFKGISDKLQDMGVSIRTAEEDQSILTNKEQEWREKFEKTQDEKPTSSQYSKLAGDIFDLTGVKNIDNAPVKDYLRTALTEFTNQYKSNSNNEVVEDQPNISNSNGALLSEKELKIQELTNQIQILKSKDEEYANLLAEKDQQVVANMIDSKINGIRSKFNKNLDEGTINDIIAVKKAKLLQDFEPANEDGKKVWKSKQTGLTYRNNLTAEPITTDELIGEAFKSIIVEDRKQEGIGTNNNTSIKVNDRLVSVDPNIETQADLHDALKKSGEKSGTTEYTKAFEELKEKLNITRLR